MVLCRRDQASVAANLNCIVRRMCTVYFCRSQYYPSPNSYVQVVRSGTSDTNSPLRPLLSFVLLIAFLLASVTHQIRIIR